MYAVFKSGGKQHRVQEGDTVRLEKLEVETGSMVDFDEVLVVGEGESISIGAPYVSGSVVSGEVVSHGRAAKVNIIKFRRRKHHMKRAGHRQWFTEVKITGIASSSAAPAAGKAAPEVKAAPSAEPAPKEEAATPRVEAAPKAAAEAGAGDLSAIKGVGPAMIEKLAGAGIPNLEALAGLSDADKARIGEELNIAAKLDAWIEQAKELVSGEG